MMTIEEMITGLHNVAGTLSKLGGTNQANWCHRVITELENWQAQEGVAKEACNCAEYTTRGSILEDALRCVCHDRNAQYGEPEDNFRIIGDFWSLYLGRDVTPHDVGVMMALFKVGRIIGGGVKADNYVDACGYLACAGEIAALLEAR